LAKGKSSKPAKTESLKSDLFLDPARVRDAKSPSPLGNTILIIGFDTEYQKAERKADAEDDPLSNTVLSYQYCCTLLYEDAEDADVTWSGIIYPASGSVADRLCIPDFIHHALQHGFSLHPHLIVPPSIFLAAHFTRADVPGFFEFKDPVLRDRLLLQNIRSNFMNIQKPFKVDFSGGDGKKPVTFDVFIRDTMVLSPAGSRSLEDLGKILGVAKLKLSDDPDREYHLKTHMSELLEQDRDLFERYAIRDAEICAKYSAKMVRANDRNTGLFKLPNTLSSKGIHLLTSFWGGKGLAPLAVVGKEVIEETVWKPALKRLVKQKRTVFLQQLSWSEQFLTEAFHGGRNEQFWFGPAPESIWYDYDLASAYPSAMALIGMPDWSRIHTITDTDELLSDKFASTDLAYANVDFEFPDDVRYPVLPVRTDFGLIFPRRGNSTTHISEIKLAHRLGCKITLIDGKYIKSVGGGDPALKSETIRPFADFAKYCVDQRNKSSKGSLDNLLWKEIVNSTYGKTAQGLRERRVYDLRDAETKVLPPSDITNPAFASFITAFCRGVLGEIMNALPRDVMIFSVTTDGFLTTASPAQMQQATTGELSRFYQKSRVYLSEKNDIYEVKHLIRRPLGWRTRAQATLTPSKPEDWKGSGAAPTEDGSLVLAKGGIKLNSRLSKAEQNAEILKLFAGRKPSDRLDYTIGMGIRDMYIEGTDFVDKEVTKRLSMEFDWKRKPTAPYDADAPGGAFEDDRHLAFSSVPWRDVREFMRTREVWATFQQSNPLCLKTRDDFQKFATYAEGKAALTGKAGKYLSHENGTRTRVRQQIIIAQKFGRAGAHSHNSLTFGRSTILSDKKLTAQQLADFFTEIVGLPTKKHDIDNERRNKNVFTPGLVPNNPVAMSMLLQVRDTLFPDLQIEEFLSTDQAYQLVSDD
jgi:hypothetical protein